MLGHVDLHYHLDWIKIQVLNVFLIVVLLQCLHVILLQLNHIIGLLFVYYISIRKSMASIEENWCW